MSRRRLLQLVGALLCVPSAIVFFMLLNEGTDSPLVYVAAAAMYVGFALTLYASLVEE